MPRVSVLEMIETPTPSDVLVGRLERVVVQELARRMPPHPTEDTSTWELREWLFHYANWRYRLVDAQPRRVHVSKLLRRQMRTSEHTVVLTRLIGKLEAGEDVGPHLTTRTRDAYADRANGGQDRGRDRMLADWGVQHLHLGAEPHPRVPGFVARTSELLFAVIEPHDAHLIGIFGHGDWVSRDVVRTAMRAWPDADLFTTSNRVLGFERGVTEDEHRQLRAANVNVGFMVDGVAVLPSGITGAGTSSTVARANMYTLDRLRQWRADAVDRLAAVENVRPGAYWTPCVVDERCGFRADGVFVPVTLLTTRSRLAA